MDPENVKSGPVGYAESSRMQWLHVASRCARTLCRMIRSHGGYCVLLESGVAAKYVDDLVLDALNGSL